MNIIKKIKETLFKIPIAILAGILGAWGGAQGTSKLWRRLGVSAIIAIFAWFKLKTIWAIGMIGYFIPLTFGYGLPDPPHFQNPDEGSRLGRFWFRILNKNPKWSEIFTRGTIGLVEALVSVIIPLIKGNWIVYGFCSLGIILINVFFGGEAIIKNEGVYYLFKKQLLWEETYIYFGITLMNIILILF